MLTPERGGGSVVLPQVVELGAVGKSNVADGLTLVVPPGTQPFDLLLAVLLAANNNAATPNITDADGFLNVVGVGEVEEGAGGGGTNRRASLATYLRRAAAGEAGTSWAFTSTGANASWAFMGVIIRIHGAPISVSNPSAASDSTTAVTTRSTPGIATIHAPFELIVRILGGVDPDPATVAWATSTELLDDQHDPGIAASLSIAQGWRLAPLVGIAENATFSVQQDSSPAITWRFPGRNNPAFPRVINQAVQRAAGF